MLSGTPAFLYPSPLHHKIVPELVYQSNATILFGTDTFLRGYARTAIPYDFRSLRYVFAGAEAVQPATRAVWLERFGVRLLEGYGATETSPLLAVNTPLFNRSGTVGRLMPMIEARLEPVDGIAEGGRLFVRGPNVMLGYLRVERPGELQPLAHGWYDTGDIVTIDDEGFVRIVDRAGRFAKVGGEKISLTAVEALAAEVWPDARHAAITLPDARKGERIVLVSETAPGGLERLRAHAGAKDVAEIMLPAELREQTIPLLGSGKTDRATLKRSLLAETAPEAQPAA